MEVLGLLSQHVVNFKCVIISRFSTSPFCDPNPIKSSRNVLYFFYWIHYPIKITMCCWGKLQNSFSYLFSRGSCNTVTTAQLAYYSYSFIDPHAHAQTHAQTHTHTRKIDEFHIAHIFPSSVCPSVLPTALMGFTLKLLLFLSSPTISQFSHFLFLILSQN